MVGGGAGVDVGVGGNIENGVGVGEGWNGNWSGLGVDKSEDKVSCKTKAGQLRLFFCAGRRHLQAGCCERKARMREKLSPRDRVGRKHRAHWLQRGGVSTFTLRESRRPLVHCCRCVFD